MQMASLDAKSFLLRFLVITAKTNFAFIFEHFNSICNPDLFHLFLSLCVIGRQSHLRVRVHFKAFSQRCSTENYPVTVKLFRCGESCVLREINNKVCLIACEHSCVYRAPGAIEIASGKTK